MLLSAPYACLLLGGTGAVGQDVLRSLVKSPRCTSVIVAVRGLVEDGDDVWAHPKVHQVVVDFEEVCEAMEEQSAAAREGMEHEMPVCLRPLFQEETQVTLCALGTTRRAAGSAENFRRVDHDYVLALARAAQQYGGCRHFGYVSSMGASSSSWFLYPKTKGLVEQHLEELEFPALTIMRPGLLDAPHRKDARLLESLAQKLFRVINPVLVGPLRKYRSIKTSAVASALVHEVEAREEEGVVILSSQEIQQLADQAQVQGEDRE